MLLAALDQSLDDLMVVGMRPHMSTTKQYRAKSNGALADNEEWLANNLNKTLQASDEASPDKVPDENKSGPVTLAAEEEHVLRCLGAAVIMHWNTIGTKLQRELFDTAGSMGELLATAELRGQIARCLHKHKDDDSAA